MVLETIAERGDRFGAVTRVAQQLGIGPESLRKWVHQAEVDGGKRTGLTTEERERLKLFERENRELRRANEMVKSTAAFFGFLSPSSLPGRLAHFFGVPAAEARDCSSLCRPPGTPGRSE